MIWSTDRAEREIGSYNKQLIAEFTAATKTDLWDRQRNQVRLDREELRSLMDAVQLWKKQVGFGTVPISTGNKTPPSDRVLVEGWTTMAKRFDVGEGGYFVLYSYPGGRIRRSAFRLAEKVINDPLRTPSANEWQGCFVNNSVIPTIELTPEFGGNRDIVIMPYLDLINAFDVFARPDQIRNWEQFLTIKGLPWRDAMKLMQTASVALRAKHEQGKVVGESTLQNLSITKSGLPLWTEAEMGYRARTAPINRFARDVHTLCVSGWNVLACHYGDAFDPDLFGDSVLAVHSADVLREMTMVGQENIPWAQRKAFEYIGQFRTGADLKAFEAIRSLVRAQVDALLATI